MNYFFTFQRLVLSQGLTEIILFYIQDFLAFPSLHWTHLKDRQDMPDMKMIQLLEIKKYREYVD